MNSNIIFFEKKQHIYRPESQNFFKTRLRKNLVVVKSRVYKYRPRLNIIEHHYSNPRFDFILNHSLSFQLNA